MAKETETKIEGKQDSSSVEETKPAPESTEESTEESVPEEKGPVPYSRFKEVINQRDTSDKNYDVLKKEIEDLKSKQSPEEEPEGWKEAQDRTVKKAVTEIERKAQEKADNIRKEDERIESSFVQLEALGETINIKVKKAVLTEMIKAGDVDVYGAYLRIKKATETTEKTEQEKKDGFVPGSDKGSTGGETGRDYKQLRDTPLEVLVDEAVKKAKK